MRTKGISANCVNSIAIITVAISPTVVPRIIADVSVARASYSVTLTICPFGIPIALLSNLHNIVLPQDAELLRVLSDAALHADYDLEEGHHEQYDGHCDPRSVHKEQLPL